MLTVLQLTVYFLIPFCVCLALGVFINPLEAIAASACVLMVSSFVPLPGAAGGAEGSFLVFFGMFLTDGSKTGTAILLWRLITFYLTIVIGMFFAQNMGKTKAVCSVQEQIKELEQGADKFE